MNVDNLASLFESILEEHNPTWNCPPEDTQHTTKDIAWGMAIEAIDWFEWEKNDYTE